MLIFTEQKQKYGSYTFNWFDPEKSISKQSFDFAMAIFKKSQKLIELRNIITHSHLRESWSVPELRHEDLRGSKDIETVRVMN